jgi:tetratricopeptide (TPR) repeat protein
LEGRAQLNVARHGSISLPVNYHAFTRVCVQDGGLALVPSRAHASIAVIGLLALPDAGRHEETQRAYRLHVGDFGPDDFYSIARHARDTTARMSAADILAYLRLSRHDSRQLEQHLPRLMELASELDAPMRENLIEAVEEVWDMYFPLGEAFDLANGIARLLHTMDDCERALIFYERSMAIYGPDTGTLCNIAACYRRLGEGARAAAVLHKVLEYDPGNAAATALLASADR